ncbi:MAG: BACON domain-containing protein, partial [Planctomycetota bacterium]
FGQTGSLNSSELTIAIDPTYAEYGLNTCQFTISDPNASNSPQVVTVTLDVLRPEIGVSPASILFECDVDEPNVLSQVLEISNTGYDTLNWNLTEECEWLSVSPISGQCVSGPNEVTLKADTARLEIGFYDAQLTITDNNASNSPVSVSVSLHVYRDGERHVPIEYPTIQQAIDAAVDGDHVVVHPGRYYESCNVYNNIIIRSINPDDVEIINSTILNG